MAESPDTRADAPWKQRFRVTTTWTQIAKTAPTRGMAASNRTGTFQLYAWEVASGALHQRTDNPTGIIAGTIAPDGRFIYYFEDHAGDEIGHYVRVPWTGGPPENITPTLPPYSSRFLGTSRGGTCIGLTAADRHGTHVYVVPRGADDALGEPQRLHSARCLLLGPQLSADGTLAVVATTERSGSLHFSLLAFDLATQTPIGELWDGAANSIEPRMFSPVAGAPYLLATSNCSGAKRPLLWNVRTGERIDLHLGDLPGDITPHDWSSDGRLLVLQQFHQAMQRLFVYDLSDFSLHALDAPRGTYGGVYFVPGGALFAHWQDSTHPNQVIELDRSTGRQTGVVLPSAEVPSSRPWRAVLFPSSDGQRVHGWLATPDGDGPFPTIVELHGGPDIAQTKVFSAGSQAWLDHGYAFLSINYRGSTTFGKRFEEQIWGQLGQWELEDLAAAHAWLVREGIAQPEAMFVSGWSYGGYLALLALGRQPTLWAGGMAGIAIADWAETYADSSDMLKDYVVAFFNGTPEEQPEQYAASSPISYAAQVTAPVLVMQGRNDSRCPARQMRQYEARLRALGKSIEVHWFEGGHGSYDTAQAIRHQELMLQFTERVLKS